MYIYLNLYILFVHITLLHKHQFYRYPLLIAHIYSLFFFSLFCFFQTYLDMEEGFEKECFLNALNLCWWNFIRFHPLLFLLYSSSPPLPPSPPRTHFSPRRARGHSTNCIQCIKKTRTTFQVTTMMISPLRSYSRVFLSYPHPDVRYSDIGYNFLASMLFRPKF